MSTYSETSFKSFINRRTEGHDIAAEFKLNNPLTGNLYAEGMHIADHREAGAGWVLVTTDGKHFNRSDDKLIELEAILYFCEHLAEVGGRPDEIAVTDDDLPHCARALCEHAGMTFDGQAIDYFVQQQRGTRNLVTLAGVQAALVEFSDWLLNPEPLNAGGSSEICSPAEPAVDMNAATIAEIKQHLVTAQSDLQAFIDDMGDLPPEEWADQFLENVVRQVNYARDKIVVRL